VSLGTQKTLVKMLMIPAEWLDSVVAVGMTWAVRLQTSGTVPNLTTQHVWRMDRTYVDYDPWPLKSFKFHTIAPNILTVLVSRYNGIACLTLVDVPIATDARHFGHD
jgi:hypothetical protein